MSFARKFRWFGSDGSSPVILGDDKSGDMIGMEPPGHDRTVIDRPKYDAAYRSLYDGKNELETLTWKVDRDHGDADKARTFSRMHHADVKTKGVLEDSGDGYTTLFLLGATIQTRCISLDGQSTIFEYTVRGGPWSTKAI